MHRDTGLLGLASLILVSICLTVNGHPGCPSDLPDTSIVTQFQGKCYQFVQEEKYWSDARDYCWKYGGGLVMIPNHEVNEYIINVVNGLSSWKNNGIWIGLNDKRNELVWKWVTNSEFNFIPLNPSWTNWAKGYPEGFWHSAKDCIRMIRKENWKWVETYCTTLGYTYRFICQYDYVPPTTTPTQPEPNLGFMVGNAQPDKHNSGRVASTNKPDNHDLTSTTANQDLNQPDSKVEQNYVPPTTTPTKPEPNLGLMVGNAQPDMHNSGRVASTNNPDNHDLTSTTANQDLNQSDKKVEQNAVDIDGSAAAMNGDQRKHNTQLAVILGAVGASGFLIIAVIIVVIKRRQSKDQNVESSQANPSYTEPTTVKGMDTITKGTSSGLNSSCRNDNLYVDITPTTNDDQFTQHDGYLAPKSLMQAGQISDTYLTTAEAKSPYTVGIAKHEPPMFIQCEAANENMCSSGYLPMKGMNERINSGSQSRSRSVVELVRNQESVEDGYELPTAEPIYAEIPERKPDDQTKN